MYAIDSLDRVIPYPAIPTPDVGAPSPLVGSNEDIVGVAFVTRDEDVAVVRFRGFAAYLFGQPNDDALSGHPLESRGLEPYGSYEIIDSSWRRSLERQNAVHPNHDPAQYARLRHFIISFHDTTFECVAEGAEVSVRSGDTQPEWNDLEAALAAKVV